MFWPVVRRQMLSATMHLVGLKATRMATASKAKATAPRLRGRAGRRRGKRRRRLEPPSRLGAGAGASAFPSPRATRRRARRHRREQLIIFDAVALRGLRVRAAADASLALHAPLPQWARDGVLLSADLLPTLFGSVNPGDWQAAAACSAWRAAWNALLRPQRYLHPSRVLPIPAAATAVAEAWGQAADDSDLVLLSEQATALCHPSKRGSRATSGIGKQTAPMPPTFKQEAWRHRLRRAHPGFGLGL